MKAEHRLKADHGHKHREEMRTNVLADRMGRFMQNVRHRPRGRTLLIWVVVIVVLLGGGAYWLWSRASTERQSNLWRYLYQGGIEEIIKEYPDGKQAEIAELERYWAFLWETTGQVPVEVTDPKTGQKKTEVVVLQGGIANLRTYPKHLSSEKVNKGMKAWFGELERVYSDLANKHKNDPILGPECLYNLAVAQETLAVFELKKLDAAKATFTKLSDEFKDSARGLLAKQRLEEVYSKDKIAQLKDFYQELNAEHQLDKDAE